MSQSIDSMPAYKKMKRVVYRTTKMIETGINFSELTKAHGQFAKVLADLELQLDGRNSEVVNELTEAAKCLTVANNRWIKIQTLDPNTDTLLQRSWKDFRKHCIQAMFIAENPWKHKWNKFLAYVRIKQKEAEVQRRQEVFRASTEILEARGEELMEAVRSGDLAAAQEIIGKGVFVDTGDDKGDTALIVAARRGDVAMVRLLLQESANLNARNKGGQTALMQISQNDSKIIPLLLENGADPDIRDNSGQTALERSQKVGLVDRIDLLTGTTR